MYEDNQVMYMGLPKHEKFKNFLIERFFELEDLDKETPEGVNVERVVLDARKSEVRMLLRKFGVNTLYLKEDRY